MRFEIFESKWFSIPVQSGLKMEVKFTMYSVQCKMYSVQCTVHCALSTTSLMKSLQLEILCLLKRIFVTVILIINVLTS